MSLCTCARSSQMIDWMPPKTTVTVPCSSQASPWRTARAYKASWMAFDVDCVCLSNGEFQCWVGVRNDCVETEHFRVFRCGKLMETALFAGCSKVQNGRRQHGTRWHVSCLPLNIMKCSQNGGAHKLQSSFKKGHAGNFSVFVFNWLRCVGESVGSSSNV